MESIPPKKRDVMCPQPNAKPVAYPTNIMPATMVTAPVTAVPPTLTNFLKLKSSPNVNRRKMTPISDHVLMLLESITLGVNGHAGPLMIPATI